jgi:hypothetical protein
MSVQGNRGRVERAERWAIMEWIVMRGRLPLAIGLVFLLLAGAAYGILLSIGVSHMDKSETETFVHRQLLYPRNKEGPILEHVPPE